METNCSKCGVTLDVYKVRYNKRYYCPACMDQIDDDYFQKMRDFRLNVKNGKIITHDS